MWHAYDVYNPLYHFFSNDDIFEDYINEDNCIGYYDVDGSWHPKED